MPPLVVRLQDGDVELREWPAWAARVLDEMVLLAGPEFPEGPARERLFPLATADKEHGDEWRRNVHPELFALFASARDIVAKDLAAAVRVEDGDLVRLRIPVANVPGWIAALNAARLHLGAAHDVDANAMQAPLDELTPEMRGVVARIDLLAELQFHLIRGDEPPLPPPRSKKPARAPKAGRPRKTPKPGGPGKPKKPRKPRPGGPAE